MVQHDTRNSYEIVTDSRYTKDCFDQYIGNWKQNGWQTVDGGPVKNQDLIKSIDSKVNQRRDLGLDVKFTHVKGK